MITIVMVYESAFDCLRATTLNRAFTLGPMVPENIYFFVNLVAFDADMGEEIDE